MPSQEITLTELNRRLSSRAKSLVNIGLEATELFKDFKLTSGLSFKEKSDGSPVTEIDLQIEEFIRRKISQLWPNDLCLGEELQDTEQIRNTNCKSEYRWIIDPIDGTEALTRGVPLFAIQLALELRTGNSAEVIAGGAFFPLLNECVIAEKNSGAWQLKQASATWTPAVSRKTSMLSQSRGCITSVDHWFDTPDRQSFFNRLVLKSKNIRGWGDAFGYLLVATGRADFMIDATIKPWDIAPWVVIIAEAGGMLTALSEDQFSTYPLDGALAVGGGSRDLIDEIRCCYGP